MKNLLILTVSILTINFGVLTAQTNKGTKFIGVSTAQNFTETGYDIMSLGYSSSTIQYYGDGDEESDPTKLININLIPKVGYFILDNLVVGLDINLAYSKEYRPGGSKYYEWLYGAGPFVRYYIPKSKIIPFFELNSIYGIYKEKYSYSIGDNLYENEYYTRFSTFGGSVGIAVPISKKVNFDILAGYSYFISKVLKNNPRNYKEIEGKVGLKLGFTILLAADKKK